MKSLFTMCLLLFLGTAFAQYPMNYRVAPHNPIPKQYTTDQYLIYHNVKSLRYKVGNIDWLFEFDKEGRSTLWDTGIGKTTYSYDSKGHLKSVNDGYSTSRYKTNDKGYIIEEKYSDGSGSIYKYNDDGLYAYKIDRATGAITEQYTYDELGRIKGAIYFSKTGEVLQRSAYSYEDLVKFTKVNEAQTNEHGRTVNLTHYYSKRGEYLSQDYENDVITLDIKSNPTSHYKSADDETITFEITYY
ncbi:hypothetical protein ACFQO1_02185 [Jejudonia soesokkakensis]|uniref:YD repeat-containing protein n=1 Tax=Jejudonia soesokkakensis TaxID=1323432 RepID=A0ABW2MNL2_9FLAO